jgi:hypothetical protein
MGGTKSKYVYVQPTTEQSLSNQRTKIGLLQTSIDQQLRFYDSSLNELDSYNKAVLDTLAQQIKETQTSTATEVKVLQEQVAQEAKEAAEQLQLLQGKKEKLSQHLLDLESQKDLTDQKLALLQVKLDERKRELDSQKETLMEIHRSLENDVAKSRANTAETLQAFLGSSTVCDASVTGLVDLLSHLNALPFETNKTTLNGIHDYLSSVCASMRATTAQFSEALTEHSNMGLEDSIEWARNNTPSKVAEWMKAEEIDIGTLISCTPQELKEAMPIQLNSILFNRLLTRLEQVKNNENQAIEDVQQGMKKLSMEISPALTWSDPMQSITASISSNDNRKLLQQDDTRTNLKLLE